MSWQTKKLLYELKNIEIAKYNVNFKFFYVPWKSQVFVYCEFNNVFSRYTMHGVWDKKESLVLMIGHWDIEEKKPCSYFEQISAALKASIKSKIKTISNGDVFYGDSFYYSNSILNVSKFEFGKVKPLTWDTRHSLFYDYKKKKFTLNTNTTVPQFPTGRHVSRICSETFKNLDSFFGDTECWGVFGGKRSKDNIDYFEGFLKDLQTNKNIFT